MNPITDTSFWMTVGDIPNMGPLTVKIESIQERLAYRGRHLYKMLTAKFQGVPKELPLNETNQKRLAIISGDDRRESWVGMTVDLFVAKAISPGGRLVDVIRIRPASGGGA